MGVLLALWTKRPARHGARRRLRIPFLNPRSVRPGKLVSLPQATSERRLENRG
jgi:hypothetical protein